MIGQLVVSAVICVMVVITIDAIAHPEVTELRCNIKCAKSLHYIGRESAQLEVPDTGIPRQVSSYRAARGPRHRHTAPGEVIPRSWRSPTPAYRAR